MPRQKSLQPIYSDQGRTSTGLKRNLTQKIYNDVREMILNCEVTRGQRLIFADLARQMRVSRTPVNNALAILAKEGFLDFTPNQGYRVHRTTETEAEALYDILNLYCVGSISGAIRSLTLRHIAELEKRKIEYEKAVVEQRYRLRVLLDQEFHAYLIHLSGNPFMAGYFRDAYQKIHLWPHFDELRPERARQVIAEHHEIVEAVRRRDTKEAKTLMTKHIEASKAYVFSELRSDTHYPLSAFRDSKTPSVCSHWK